MWRRSALRKSFAVALTKLARASTAVNVFLESVTAVEFRGGRVPHWSCRCGVRDFFSRYSPATLTQRRSRHQSVVERRVTDQQSRASAPVVVPRRRRA